MEMSDFTWQHQKYSTSEIYVVMYVVSQITESFLRKIIFPDIMLHLEEANYLTI